MEIKEIFETIEGDPNMDKELQDEILERIDNIAKADKLVDGLEAQIEEHKDELSEKELKYIINKCIAYKSVFYKFRNGAIVDYDMLNNITDRIFELEDGIRNNDFNTWKQEVMAYKGSKEDKEEEKRLKNMLMVVPEETNIVEKITRMFKKAIWNMKQKSKQKEDDTTKEEKLDAGIDESSFEDNTENDLEEKVQEKIDNTEENDKNSSEN